MYVVAAGTITNRSGTSGPGEGLTDGLDATEAFGLSGREQQVLRLVANGHTNLEIAETLCISHRTVKAHVSNILSKVGAANRCEAAVAAVSAGII